MKQKTYPVEGIQNLALLALGLHRLDALVANKRFDIRTYQSTAPGVYAPIASLRFRAAFSDQANACRTTACAVGHGPIFGIHMELDLTRKYYGWDDYMHGVFCAPASASDSWRTWCFGAFWSYHTGQETRAAAAKRIAWILLEKPRLEPYQYIEYVCLPTFKDWEPDWKAIETMIPDEKLEGIAWLY